MSESEQREGSDEELRSYNEEGGEQTLAELQTQLAALETENQRLRRDYPRARRSQYRRTALGMAAIGLIALAGGFLFPPNRNVLFALGGTGLFASLLTYYLTPEPVIPASVGERVYDALAETEGDLVSELGLQPTRVYVPTEDPDLGVRLFIPLHAVYEIPTTADLRDVFVVPESEAQRGVSLAPSGLRLFEEFQGTLTDELASDPATLAEQLQDGLVEQFELARSVRTTVSTEENRLSVGIAGSSFGDIDRFDHPIPSFIAVGLAAGLEEPVAVELTDSTDDRIDHLVTCTWGLDTDQGDAGQGGTEG